MEKKNHIISFCVWLREKKKAPRNLIIEMILYWLTTLKLIFLFFKNQSKKKINLIFFFQILPLFYLERNTKQNFRSIWEDIRFTAALLSRPGLYFWGRGGGKRWIFSIGWHVDCLRD